MKKLRHELKLTITGPNDAKASIENCIKQGVVAGALAALGTSFIGAGIGATGAALSAFQSQFLACAGQQVDIRVDDDSHWIEWVT